MGIVEWRKEGRLKTSQRRGCGERVGERKGDRNNRTKRHTHPSSQFLLLPKSLSNSCFSWHTCIQNSCFPSPYLPFRLFSPEAGCPLKFPEGLLAFEFLAPKAYLPIKLFKRSAHSAGPTIFQYLHDLISC